MSLDAYSNHVGVVLMEFLKFYVNFDYSTDGISVNGPFKKEMKAVDFFPKNQVFSQMAISIENPQDPSEFLCHPSCGLEPFANALPFPVSAPCFTAMNISSGTNNLIGILGTFSGLLRVLSKSFIVEVDPDSLLKSVAGVTAEEIVERTSVSVPLSFKPGSKCK